MGIVVKKGTVTRGNNFSYVNKKGKKVKVKKSIRKKNLSTGKKDDSKKTNSKKPIEESPPIGIHDHENKQSRYLTEHEKLLYSSAVGMSRHKPNTFGQETEEVMILRNGKTSRRVNIGSKTILKEGVRKVIKEKEQEKFLREKAITGTDEEFKNYITDTRIKNRNKLKNIKPRYGAFDGKPGNHFLGIMSESFQGVGLGAESLIDEASLRVSRKRHKNSYDNNYYSNSQYFNPPVFKENVLSATSNTLDFTKGLFKGGVSNVGKDKTTAAIIAGSTVAGTGVGLFKGSGLVSKFTNSNLGKFFTTNPKGKAFTQGIGKGFGAGFTGIIGYDVATSKNKPQRVGEIGGEILSFGAGFSLGSNLGTSSSANIRSSIMNKKFTNQFKKTGEITVPKDLNTNPISSTIDEIRIVRTAKRTKGVVKEEKRVFIDYGKSSEGGFPSKDKLIKFDYDETLGLAKQSSKTPELGNNLPKSIFSDGGGYKNLASSNKVLFQKKSQSIFSANGFENVIGSRNIRSTSYLAEGGDSIGFLTKKGSVSYINKPSVSHTSTSDDILRLFNSQKKLGTSKDFYLTSDAGKYRYDLTILKDEPVKVVTGFKTRSNVKATGENFGGFGGLSFGGINNNAGGGTTTILKPPLSTSKAYIDLDSFFMDSELSVSASSKSKSFNKAFGGGEVGSSSSKEGFKVFDFGSKNIPSNSFDLKPSSNLGISARGRNKNLFLKGLKEDTGLFSRGLSGNGSKGRRKAKISDKSLIKPSTIISSSPMNKGRSSFSFKPLTSPKEIIAPSQFLNYKSSNLLKKSSKKTKKGYPGGLGGFFGKESNKTRGGYDVFVKKRGSFNLLGSGLTKNEALRIGSDVVSNTSSATFKISGGKNTGLKIGNFLNKNNFYQKTPNTFIEKRGKRIKSGGELNEITFKGLRTLRGGFKL